MYSLLTLDTGDLCLHPRLKPLLNSFLVTNREITLGVNEFVLVVDRSFHTRAAASSASRLYYNVFNIFDGHVRPSEGLGLCTPHLASQS